MAVDSSTAALSDYSVARVFSPHLVLSPVFAQTRFFCLCVLYDHLLFLWTWWICLKIFIQWRTVALVPLSPIRFDYCPLFSRFTLSKHSQTRCWTPDCWLLSQEENVSLDFNQLPLFGSLFILIPGKTVSKNNKCFTGSSKLKIAWVITPGSPLQCMSICDIVKNSKRSWWSSL